MYAANVIFCWVYIHIRQVPSDGKCTVFHMPTIFICFEALSQNGRHFPDDISRWIFLNENVWISIKISLKFFPRGPIKGIPSLVQIMAWHRPGDKPLSEPMVVSLLTHICVTGPQWVKNKIQWNRNWNSYVFIQENAFEYVVCEMTAILSRPQCVNPCYAETGTFPVD